MSDYKDPLWPNGLQKDEEGYAVFYPLGTNKVDITTITWPDGDKLVSPFVYQNGKLVGFVDTKAMSVSGSATTTMNYSHIEADFSSIVEGTLTVDAPNATIKKFKWAVSTSGDTIVLGTKYINCTRAEDVRTVDQNYYINDVKDGVWSESLANLKDPGFVWIIGGDSGPSEYIFQDCDNLIIFNSDLSSLIYGGSMFRDCNNLTSFNANLSKLEDGDYMFWQCTNLTSFNANLSSLQYGEMMFSGCKLDAHSIKNMIDTISADVMGLTLGMGCNNTTEDKDLFAQEVGYADMTSLIGAFYNNNVLHIIDFQFNGRPTSTYSLRRPAGNTLPVFVKLEETEKYADYTLEDGSKKFRLKWFHETTGSTEGYTQFNSLEEAIEHFNIKPIERN